MENFTDKVVVITGGATGIGFSFAKQFGREGAKIVISGRRESKLQEAVSALTGLGIEAKYHASDVSIREDVEALADFAWSIFGHVDVIMANAGISEAMSTIIDVDPAEVRRLYEINFFGAWSTISVFGKRIIQQGKPAYIYATGSENSFFDGFPFGGGPYVSAKYALLAIMDILRTEVPDFIKVGLICPGVVQSQGIPEGLHAMDTDKYTDIAMPQIKNGEFFIVSHPNNMVYISKRYEEVSQAYARYAPRYEGDDEYDILAMMANLTSEDIERMQSQRDL